MSSRKGAPAPAIVADDADAEADDEADEVNGTDDEEEAAFAFACPNMRRPRRSARSISDEAEAALAAYLVAAYLSSFSLCSS